MAILNKKAKDANYISAKEARRISKENRKITDKIEKQRNRKHIPREEYVTKMHDENNVVEFDNLHTYFFTDIGTVKSVDGVSFEVPQGKTVGIVGESGCGKSVTSLSLMQLVQRPQGQVVEGQIRLNMGNGEAYDIPKTPLSEMQKIRGNKVSMIFQEPMTSLNPVLESVCRWMRLLLSIIKRCQRKMLRQEQSRCLSLSALPTVRAFIICILTSFPAVCASVL